MQVPQPQQPTPSKKTIVFANKTYYFTDKKSSILLPVRPDPTNDPAVDRATTREFNSAIKAIILKLESTNNNQIILMHSNDFWWQFGSNSLLFYAYHLQKSFGLIPVSPHLDRDFGKVKYPRNPGCASIKNIQLFRHQLTTQAHAQIILSSPEIIIFQLPHAYSPADIESFQNIYTSKEAHFNSLALPKNVHPNTYRIIMHLAKLIVDKSSCADTYRRHVYFRPGVENILWIGSSFIEMSNGNINLLHFYNEVVIRTRKLSNWLVLLRGVNVLDLDSAIRIAEEVETLRVHAESHIAEFKAARTAESNRRTNNKTNR